MSLERIRAVLKASEGVGFKGRNRQEVYGRVSQTLQEQGYQDWQRRGRGWVRLHVEKMTG